MSFQAVPNPTNGPVDCREGVQNLLWALRLAKRVANWKSSRQEGIFTALDVGDSSAVEAAAPKNATIYVVFFSCNRMRHWILKHHLVPSDDI